MSIAGLPPLANSKNSYAVTSSAPAAPADTAATKSGNAAATDQPAAAKPVKAKGDAQLTPEQLALLSALQARDRQVRQHEQAHLAASGSLALSGPSYTYQKGPDGVSYAIGGEVSIDVSPGRTPQETIARAEQIQAAALAPADPSGPDRAIAAQAQQLELEARAQLAQQAQQASAGATGQGRQKTEPQARISQIYGAIANSSFASGRIDTYA